MRPPLLDNPPNPWASTEREYLEEIPPAQLELYEDLTQDILSRNDSPDVGFRFSVNPYRGCRHACAYCYARPTHEYLGFGAGTDFDTRVVVKRKAAELLRRAFDRPSWKGETVAFSGVTDCYQPLEASLRLTRACLEVCAEYQNPVALITKAPLIERDLDVLQTLHRHARLEVRVSVPFYEPLHARAMEPYVATPRRRLQTVERLAQAGIPVGVMVAPLIPGLSDEDLVRVLTHAREAGAKSAGYVLLRLPGSVAQVFESRLRRALPLRADRVLHRLRETRGGALYDGRFGARGKGTGRYALAIAQLFTSTCKRLGLACGSLAENEPPPPSPFHRPVRPSPQLALF